jgi:drug/metabolite transporter (DMT)-like permease
MQRKIREQRFNPVKANETTGPGRGTERPATAAYVFLTLTALFLAINYVIGRGVHEEIPPVGLSFWRWVVGALILAPFVLHRPGTLSRIFVHHTGVMLLLGCMVVGSTTLLLVALNSTTAINVSVINAVQPGLTVLFAWIFRREAMTGRQLLGIGAACVGVLIMLSGGRWQTLAGFELSGGSLIALLAMCGLAGYAVSLFRLPPELNFAESLFGIIVMGSLALLPFYLIESFFVATVPPGMKTLSVVFTLALLVSVLAMLMWNYGNHRIGPGRASIFINLIPVFGMILATAFLGESIQGFHIAGTACIVVGIRLAVNKPPT